MPTFFVEFLLFCAIICVLFLVLKLRDSNSNADSLKNQLNQLDSSFSARESQFHSTIRGLQDALATEQQSIKSREAELQAKEAELRVGLAEVQRNLEKETENRKKIVSQKKSSEVRLGHIAETLAPFLDQFSFDPETCVFLGRPIDYIAFEDDIITFIEVKTGKSQLSTKQRHIRDLVNSKQVAWKEIRIK